MRPISGRPPGKWPGLFVLLMGMVTLLAITGCGGPSSRCLMPVEKTGETYILGMTYLEEHKPALAAGNFKEILACNRRFSPAYSGLAVSYAQIAAAGLNPEDQTVLASLHAIELAGKYSKGNEDAFRQHLAAMRVYTTYKSRGWLGKVESEYRLAMKTRVDNARLPYYLTSDAAAYYMGRAYFDAGRIEGAMAEYRSLSRADRAGKWGRLAEKAYKRSGLILHHIEKAVAGPRVVVLAFHRDLTRQELAAILVEELGVDDLLLTNEVQMEAGREMAPVPSDIINSPFRTSILKVVALRISGLEPSYSSATSKYLFRPGRVVSRKDFAVIMDGIMKRLSLIGPGPRGGVGTHKPFSDVPPGVPWYTAVMDVTGAHVMKTPQDGLFRPYDGLDGPDAFSAVMNVKDLLASR